MDENNTTESDETNTDATADQTAKPDAPAKGGFSSGGKILIGALLVLALAGGVIGVAAPTVLEPFANMILPDEPGSTTPPKGFEE